MGVLPIPVLGLLYSTMGGGVPFGSVGSVSGSLASSYGGHVGQCDTYGSQAHGRCLHLTPRASTANLVTTSWRHARSTTVHDTSLPYAGPVQDTADGASPTDPESIRIISFGLQYANIVAGCPVRHTPTGARVAPCAERRCHHG
ncbi:hypothetical protein EDB85DRAFT_2068620 [Lactarius pseudohatsudake]|nr:hypothetical protein EDB85DRAFT_2068620 [Lactarius pseudohatsudake]